MKCWKNIMFAQLLKTVFSKDNARPIKIRQQHGSSLNKNTSILHFHICCVSTRLENVPNDDEPLATFLKRTSLEQYMLLKPTIQWLLSDVNLIRTYVTIIITVDSMLSVCRYNVLFAMFIVSENERRIKANNREYNAQFRYAVSQQIVLPTYIHSTTHLQYNVT